MTGFTTVAKIRRIEEVLANLGMRLAASRYSYEPGVDEVSIYPADDSLPHYSRDSELFTGTIEALDYWLRGIVWARGYDEMIGVKSVRLRHRKEQDQRNRQLAKVLENK